MRKATIILPTKDEEETIGETLRAIKSLELELFGIIVVDDSESIRTREIARETWLSLNSGTSFQAIKGVGNESPSIKFAIEKCVEGPVLVVDADGSQDFNIIPEMLKKLERYDVVIGSRYCKGGNPGTSSRFSGIGNDFARVMLGSDIKDLTGRYFACSKQIALDNCRWLGRGEDSIEFLINCERKKLRIKEVPFHYKPRTGGQSKTSIAKYLWVYFKRVLWLKSNRGYARGLRKALG